MLTGTYIGEGPLNGKKALLVPCQGEGMVRAQFDEIGLTDSLGIDVSLGWHVFALQCFTVGEIE